MTVVRSMAPGEESRAVDALTEAFQREELATWIDPDPRERRASLHAMFTSMMTSPPPEYVIEVTDDLGAVAIWSPPEYPVGPSGEFERPEVTELFQRIDESAPPGSYWYLAFLGAARRSEGGGRALLTHRLDVIGDRPVALWTATEANVAYYARFGFEPFSTAEVPGKSAWWLVRELGRTT